MKKMNSKLAMIVAFTLSCLFVTSTMSFLTKYAYAEREYDDIYDYSGDIDNTIGIGMSLIFYDNAVIGKYYYKKYLRDINVEGILETNRRIVLYERDTNGNTVAAFEGYFPETDPRKGLGKGFGGMLDREVIIGKWVQPGNANRSFYLSLEHIVGRYHGQGRYGFSPEDDNIIENQAQIYQRAVLSGDRATVSKFYEYPFTAKIWKRKSIYIRDSDAFIKNYDKLYSDNFKKCIKEAVPKYMFKKDTGINFGCEWFKYTNKGRLIVINPTFF